MTQEQAIVLALRIACIAGFLSLIGWVIAYTWLAKWWKNPIGRTLVTKTVLIALLLVPTTMSLFFDFNRLTSYVAAWADVILIGAITPVMIWRTAVWLKVSRSDRKGADDGPEDHVALLGSYHRRPGRLRTAWLVVV